MRVPPNAAASGSPARRRLPESEALVTARIGRGRGNHHVLPQPVAEACDPLVTKFGPGPGGHVGPVDVVGVLGGHSGQVYDECSSLTRPWLMLSVAEVGPDDVREAVSDLSTVYALDETTFTLRSTFKPPTLECPLIARSWVAEGPRQMRPSSRKRTPV